MRAPPAVQPASSPCRKQITFDAETAEGSEKKVSDCASAKAEFEFQNYPQIAPILQGFLSLQFLLP